jgi:hypothetical protein
MRSSTPLVTHVVCVRCTHPLLIHPLPLQRQKDLNNVNDTLAGLHKSVARASALPDYKEKKAEYVRDAPVAALYRLGS